MTRNRPSRLTERISGSVIDHQPPTPFQHLWVDSIRAALVSWLTTAEHGFHLEAAPEVRFDPWNELTPTLAISDGARTIPQVVIELQFESTDRLILGAKRQLYGVLGVNDYLVVPSRRDSVLSMEREPRRATLRWPPLVRRLDEDIEFSTTGLRPLPVSALTGSGARQTSQEDGDDGDPRSALRSR